MTLRRPRNYSQLTHFKERSFGWVFGRPWLVRMGQWLGMPSEVQVQQLVFDHTRCAHPELRIAFASDLHAGPTTHPAIIEHACREMAATKADLVLWGGDFVSLDARHIDQIVEHMAAVRAPLGCYAVLGNHDLWVDHRYLESRLEHAGVQVLTNRNVRLPAPFDAIWVCGLDDAESGHPDGQAALAGADEIRIILMHGPDGLLAIEGERFEAAFCGHTHGGQIALPNGTAIVLPDGRLSRRYSRGVYHLGGERRLFVSLGVGNSTVPMRLFAPPEIIHCRLTGRGSSPIAAS